MNEFLIFGVGDRTFGMQVSHVRQVVPAATLSDTADMSAEIEGYLNLRGQPVPVINLKAILGIDQPGMCDTDFLIIVRDAADRLFSIRSSAEVELTSAAQAVADDSEHSAHTEGMIRVDMQLISLLDPVAVSPFSEQPADQSQGGR